MSQVRCWNDVNSLVQPMHGHPLLRASHGHLRDQHFAWPRSHIMDWNGVEWWFFLRIQWDFLGFEGYQHSEKPWKIAWFKGQSMENSHKKIMGIINYDGFLDRLNETLLGHRKFSTRNHNTLRFTEPWTWIRSYPQILGQIWRKYWYMYHTQSILGMDQDSCPTIW